jgi:hypothetical protein
VTRLNAVVIVAALQATLIGSGLETASAQEKPSCASRETGGDNREITCPLTISKVDQRFHFKANFAGSHDDTTASMVVTLDGLPLACDAGSKTSLMGEDGEVSLDCRFRTKREAGTKTSLTVVVTWRHAQYLDFELVAN